MQGKYKTWVQFTIARISRAICHQRLRHLITWKPLRNPKSGYTIIIGCNTPLAEMVGANLRMLQQQRMEHLDRIIIVFDRPKEQIEYPVEQEMRRMYPTLPLLFLYYSEKQARVTRSFARPWVYSWASWCTGMAAAETKYCMFHDFDAMLLNPDIVESRYLALKQGDAQYCGVRHYIGNGIEFADGLAVTFELMFDLQFVRQTFHPIQVINTIGRIKGRTIDFDTLLYAQTLAGKSFLLPIPEEEMVHPQQVIDQFTRLTQIPGWKPPETNNLLMVPYFLFLANDLKTMQKATEDLQSLSTSAGTSIPFFGKDMDLYRLSSAHVDWLTKQAVRLEKAVCGAVRQEVSDYFDAIRAFVDRRNVGISTQNQPVATAK